MKAVGWISMGIAIGAAGMALAVWQLMPGMMIVTEEGRLGFDETVAAIEAGAKEKGWSSPGTLHLNRSMAKHGVEMKPQVKIVQLCHPEYAKRVLETDRYVSSLMPCTIAVWEADDGTVRVSKMNTGLMGKLFGGTIAEVMGGPVAADEAAILSEVVKE